MPVDDRSTSDDATQQPTLFSRGFGRLAKGSLLLVLVLLVGCNLPRWRNRQVAVLDLDASKEEIVQQLNRNVVGGEGSRGLQSWRSGSVKLHLGGVPVALPASVAVQAPRNFRLLVSNPLSGGQEADLGSNDDRFWIWTKENPEVMTSSHEDVGVAIEELEMPVHIHPDWLMEVFGVIPINPEEYVLHRPKVEDGYVELVADRQSPLGEDVEKVLRVNLVRGRISEHILRLPGGKVLARARLDKYFIVEDGVELPLFISLEWPDAHMKMVMDIKSPEVNPASLENHAALWKMPTHGKVVDIGAIARARRDSDAIATGGPATGVPATGQAPLDEMPGREVPQSELASRGQEAPAKVQLAGQREPALAPPKAAPRSASAPISAQGDDVPEWAR